MCGKLVSYMAFVLLLALVGTASAEVVDGQQEWNDLTQICDMGGLQITATGHAIFNDRVDHDGCDVTIEAGGILETNDTYKLPDHAGPSNVYVGGTWNAYDIESFGQERESMIYLNANGVINVATGYGDDDTEGRYNPLHWLDEGSLLVDTSLDPGVWFIEIEDLGGGAARITAKALAVEVAFDSAASGALETVSPTVLTVVLSQPAEETITVDYAATGGTATGGVDYTLAAGTLSFSAGETSKTISIDIINDGLDEDDETIVITLSNPTGPDAILGKISEHVYTIEDPRPGLGFESQTSSIKEDSGPANIPVILATAMPSVVTVDYAATGGTATGGGVDYTLNAGTLTFTPGQTTKMINISIVDDDIEEFPDETVVLTLSNATGGVKLAVAQHVLTISDMGPVWTNALGMTFLRIMPGTFTMGQGSGPDLRDSGGRDYDEQPSHLVMFTKPFYMLKTKVSQSHYQQAGLRGLASDVTWNDANGFCEWLRQDGMKYRLPTEAEWEYVHENPQGVQDMGGREWTNDWHQPFHDALAQVDPLGPASGILKVVRRDGDDREAFPPNAKSSPWPIPSMGFRVAMVFDPPENPYVSPPPFCQAAIRQNLEEAQQAPNPSTPYFTVRFAIPIPPDNDDDGDFALTGGCPSTMFHQHSPGFEVMPNGDALAVWFSAHSSGDEFDDDVRFVQARLRYGSNVWEMPELFYDFKHMNEQSGLLWTESSDKVWFFGGGRIDGSDRLPFKVGFSDDSGATWKLWLPHLSGGVDDFTPQPCQNAFRSPSGDLYFAMDGDGGESLLWKGSSDGMNWRDQGGRTNGRHSTVVMIDNNTKVLSIGGKNTDIDGYMPMCISDNWGGSWRSEDRTPFAPLGSNQRPCVTRMQNGKLAFCSDAQHRGGDKPGGSYDRGCIVAISDNDGDSWHIKNLPVTLPHESDRDDGTLGYSSIRQAPNGVLHVLSTMTHPCLHYELNEAWVFSGSGDIPPETTGGTVQQYSEDYTSGALRAVWSARICPNDRYLLHGTETFFYEDGTKEYQCTYENGKKVGTETFWTPNGIKLWNWEHQASTSKWIHYWANGFKRIESSWDTNPSARDNSRHFSGRVADGNTYQWNRRGQATQAWRFEDGQNSGSTGNAPNQSKGDIEVDLATFVRNWLWKGPGGDGGYNIADLDEDGDVDFDDYALFAWR